MSLHYAHAIIYHDIIPMLWGNFPLNFENESVLYSKKTKKEEQEQETDEEEQTKGASAGVIQFSCTWLSKWFSNNKSFFAG